MASALNIYQEFGTSNSNVYIRKKKFCGRKPPFYHSITNVQFLLQFNETIQWCNNGFLCQETTEVNVVLV